MTSARGYTVCVHHWTPIWNPATGATWLCIYCSETKGPGK